MQLETGKSSTGLVGSFRTIIREEGCVDDNLWDGHTTGLTRGGFGICVGLGGCIEVRALFVLRSSCCEGEMLIL